MLNRHDRFHWDMIMFALQYKTYPDIGLYNLFFIVFYVATLLQNTAWWHKSDYLSTSLAVIKRMALKNNAVNLAFHSPRCGLGENTVPAFWQVNYSSTQLPPTQWKDPNHRSSFPGIAQLSSICYLCKATESEMNVHRMVTTV